jgi:hypothetical protein
MPGLHHALAQRRQSHRRMAGQFSTNEGLDTAPTALAAARMGLRRTTAGGAPAPPQLLDKGEAHCKPLGHLRLALVLRCQLVNDALA